MQVFGWLFAFASVCFMNFEVSMLTHLEMQQGFLPHPSCGLQEFKAATLVWEFGKAKSERVESSARTGLSTANIE